MTTDTKQIITLASGLASQWTSTNITLPMGLIGYEYDTKKFKIGNGVTKWNSLDYTHDQTITEEHIELLNKADQANGPLVLSEDGMVPLDRLPSQVKEHIKYVANIEARDALPLEDRKCIVVVLDASGDIIKVNDAVNYAMHQLYPNTTQFGTDGGGAVYLDFDGILQYESSDGYLTLQDFGLISEEATQFIDYGSVNNIHTNELDFGKINSKIGDVTVTKSGAVYTWNGSLNNGTWMKLSEFESMDVDFSMYFRTLVDTLEIINDGLNFVKMTIPERNKLQLILTTDNTYHLQGLTPSEISTALTQIV